MCPDESGQLLTLIPIKQDSSAKLSTTFMLKHIFIRPNYKTQFQIASFNCFVYRNDCGLLLSNLSLLYLSMNVIFEPRCEKTGLRGFRPDTTQTGLHSHTEWLEA